MTLTTEPMNLKKTISCAVFFMLAGLLQLMGADFRSESVYKLKPADSDAFYFIPDNYGFRADGGSDVSVALQTAITQVNLLGIECRNVPVFVKYRQSGTEDGNTLFITTETSLYSVRIKQSGK